MQKIYAAAIAFALGLHRREAVAPATNDSPEGNTMNRYLTVGLSMLAGAALGGAAIQTLHAQAPGGPSIK